MRLWTKGWVCSIMIALMTLANCSKKVTQPPEPLPVYPIVDNAPAWSPDGQTIAYWHSGITQVYEGGRADGNPDSAGIWLINLQTKERRLFIQSGNMPDWSSDGKWLVFSSNAQIYKIRSDGEDLTQLTSKGRNFHPDWSPDSKKIAWSISIGDSQGLWIMHDNGGNKERIILYGWCPDWSPLNGETILYIGWIDPGISGGICIAKSDGSNQQIVFDSPKSNLDDPVFSTNGTKIAFGSQTDGGLPQIWVMNSNGGNLRQLTKEGGISPAWSPDGKKIVYCRYNALEFSKKNGCLWIINDVDNPDNQTQLTFWGK